jgi:hypothetical protein
MRVRIRGGTVDHGQPSLCSSCSFSVVIKGARLGDEIVVCNLYGLRQPIRFPVTSCSGYVNRNHPSLWHMEEVAWVLRSKPGGKAVGFVEARKLKDDERHVLED